MLPTNPFELTDELGARLGNENYAVNCVILEPLNSSGKQKFKIVVVSKKRNDFAVIDAVTDYGAGFVEWDMVGEESFVNHVVDKVHFVVAGGYEFNNLTNQKGYKK